MKNSCFLLLFCFFGLRLDAQYGRLDIAQLTGDFYIFTTYNSYNGALVPANGMYLVTDAGVALFDTPWDTTQFQPLLDSIGQRHGKKVIFCLATHSHEDRTGGLEFYRKHGARTYTSLSTDQISRKKGQKRAEFLLENDTTFQIGKYSFQTCYPGPGHTPDNLVLWFPQESILYGGCFVKSVEATDLGNISEADLKAWPKSIRKVQQKFPQPKYIIPGHQAWSSTRALHHTMQLLRQQHKK